MTWQISLYIFSDFTVILLAAIFAWYAWRHRRHCNGAGYFFFMMVTGIGFTASETLMMFSPTQPAAMFWSKTRYLWLAFGPALWLLFAVDFSGRKYWADWKLTSAILILPIVTQVMVWTSEYHKLWLIREASLYQDHVIWMLETRSRIPGIWFYVHTFSSALFLVIGLLIIVSGLRQATQLRWQYLMLILAGLPQIVITIMPLLDTNWDVSLNLFIPSLLISALFIAIAIFRFEFLNPKPSARSHLESEPTRSKRLHSLGGYVVVFLITTAGIIALAYLSYRRYEQHFRQQVEEELSAVAELKVRGITNWRQERLGDMEALCQNPAFISLVQDFLRQPNDVETKEQLQGWLESIHEAYRYERVYLLDAQAKLRISTPPGIISGDIHPEEEVASTLDSGKAVFGDFHKHEDGTIHLSLMGPLYSRAGNRTPLGVLVIDIDPSTYLYPYLNQWPTPSETAETLLVRREGGDVLFLTPLRFNQDAAMKLRFPLGEANLPAAMAARGVTGVIKGVDYRGVDVIADLRAVPDSPWFLVSRMDIAEVYAPLRGRLFETVIFFGALILASGTGLAFAWRRQQIHFYKEKLDAAVALRENEEKFRKFFMITPDALTISRLSDGHHVAVNPGYERMSGYTSAETLGKTSLELNLWRDPSDRQRLISELIAHGSVLNFEASLSSTTKIL